MGTCLPETCREYKYSYKEGIVHQFGFIYKPVWFLVRYSSVQRNDVAVRLLDTYEHVLDEAVTEYML
jgi:hypothetical protein